MATRCTSNTQIRIHIQTNMHTHLHTHTHKLIHEDRWMRWITKHALIDICKHALIDICVYVQHNVCAQHKRVALIDLQNLSGKYLFGSQKT